MKRWALIVCAVALAGAAPAAAHAASFSGSCKFSGPITPMPPITIVPHPGANFSYHGTGTCSRGVPIAVSFTNVATLFDTCELGPDFNLHGVATIGHARFQITINLARLALVGPFALTTSGGGDALGIAQFQPAGSPVAALQQCAAAGIASATLSASFQTVSPLMGVPDPVMNLGSPPPPLPHSRHHHHRHHHRCKCLRRGR